MTGEQPWLGFLKLHVFPFFVKMLTTTHLGNKQAFSSLAQLSVAYPNSPLTEPGSTLTANYLVGCDGARSTVRQQLGLSYDGKLSRVSGWPFPFRAKESFQARL